MGIIVQKYGGSSVATISKIKRVARRVVETKKMGYNVVVVVSAMGKTTDKLVKLGNCISNDLPEREIDVLLSTGEQVSIALLSMAINSYGYKSISLTGWQAGIKTDSKHTKAIIRSIDANKIISYLKKGIIVVIAGFQGIDSKGEITTLGRGGSDTTAVAVAAAINADRCDILTDVDGVYTTDPRVVKNAKKLQEISYDEMLELATLGAKVLHPRAVECAKHHSVLVYVGNSFKKTGGTFVKDIKGLENKQLVSGIVSDVNIAKISIMNVPDKPGIAGTIFSALSEENINVDVIIQNVAREEKNDISFTVAKADLKKALNILNDLISNVLKGAGIISDENIAKVSIVGAGMIQNPGVAAKMFRVLGEEGINIEMISTSEIKISCVIEKSFVEKAVKSLHKAFFDVV